MDITQRQIDNFWNKVDIVLGGDGCWEWLASITTYTGYGNYGNHRLKWAGLAHRFSWIINFGDIPKGLFVCHTCDNRKCVRPSHLFLGTNKENMDDRKTKNPGAAVVGEKGELHPLAKLTDALVVYIRDEYRTGRTGKELADELDIATSTIGRALTGKTWGHVPGAIVGDLYERGNRHHNYGGTYQCRFDKPA